MQTPVRKVTSQTPLNVPRASAAQFGGQEAQALQELGGSVQNTSLVVDDILKRQDTYAAQKAYNTMQDLAFNGQKDNKGMPTSFGYNDHMNRKGEQAFNSPQEYKEYLDKIKADTVAKLKTPRAQRLFLQNWEQKEISLVQSVASHAAGQVEAAHINEMGVLVESQLQEALIVSDPTEPLAQAENTFALLWKKKGGTPEAGKLAWKKTLDSWRAQKFDRLTGIKEYSQALELYGIPVRADGSLKEQGFLGELEVPGGAATEYSVGIQLDGKEVDIPTLVPTLTDAERKQMVGDIIPNRKSVPDEIIQKAVDHAKARIAEGKPVFWSNEVDGDGTDPSESLPEEQRIRYLNVQQLRDRDASEVKRAYEVNLRDAKNTISATIFKAQDPFHIPTTAEYRKAYGDDEMADAARNARVLEVDVLKKKAADEEHIAHINSPEVRGGLISTGLKRANELARPGSETTIQDAQAALDALEGVKGVEAEYARDRLGDAVKLAMSSASDAMEALKLTILTEEADQFNKANDRAGNVTRRWWPDPNLIEGDVETKEGKIKSVNEATAVFMDFINGWEATLEMEANAKGRPLTIPEVKDLRTKYFAPMRQWKHEQDFYNGAVTSVTDIYKDRYDVSPDLQRVTDVLNKIAEQMAAENLK